MSIKMSAKKNSASEKRYVNKKRLEGEPKFNLISESRFNPVQILVRHQGFLKKIGAQMYNILC
jgi:hypothetical protein